MAVTFGGWLRTPRLLGLAAACAAPVFYGVWVRPRLISWGATRDETATGATCGPPPRAGLRCRGQRPA